MYLIFWTFFVLLLFVKLFNSQRRVHSSTESSSFVEKTQFNDKHLFQQCFAVRCIVPILNVRYAHRRWLEWFSQNRVNIFSAHIIIVSIVGIPDVCVGLLEERFNSPWSALSHEAMHPWTSSRDVSDRQWTRGHSALVLYRPIIVLYLNVQFRKRLSIGLKSIKRKVRAVHDISVRTTRAPYPLSNRRTY